VEYVTLEAVDLDWCGGTLLVVVVKADRGRAAGRLPPIARGCLMRLRAVLAVEVL